MAEEEAGEGQSKAQQIARTVGVTIRLVNQTRKEVEGIVGVMERVKKLFTSTEKVATASGARTSGAVTTITERISTLGQAAAGGGGGGGGGSAIAAMMGGVGGAVMGAVGAVQNFGSSIADIHQSAEDMTNTMSGTFSALGLATDIDDGAARATAALASINAAAATLPGEASEYITVFQSGISSLASGFNNNLDDMLAFSNRFAAIGRSLGIDAEQIGRDMNLMTREGQAGAGADVATFQRMLPFINSYRRSIGQAAVSAQTFNSMQQPERINLLKNSFTALQPMIDRAGNTYSAISGEFTGHISSIKSAITAPFFTALKESMKAMNSLMSRYEGTIKSVGARIASFMTTTAGKFAQSLGPLFNEGGPLSNAMVNLTDRAKLLWGDISHGDGSQHLALGAGGAAAGAMMGGPIMALLVAGIGGFLQHTQAVGQVMTSLVGVADGLMIVFYQISTIVGDLGAGIGNGLAVILPTAADMLSQVVQGLGTFLGYVSVFVGQLQEDLGPSIMQVVGGLQSLFRGVADFVGPAMEFFGIALLMIWRKVRDDVMPVFNWLTRGISELMDGIGYLLSMLGRELRAANESGRREVGDGNDPISRALARLATPSVQAGIGAAAGAAAARTTPRTPAARGGNHTHNDFRGSNFDITQKFAEGFDPDRIAAGFISDLESAATNRIQGGFEPLFSIR